MTYTSGAQLGHYRILEPLGAGGMGEVYRARDERLERDVAIKVLSARLTGDPAMLDRFEREARAVAALTHPNILGIYEFSRDGSTCYAATELLHGESLRQRLMRGPLGARRAIETGREIAKGLAAAHEQGVIHRDLKPENVFLTRDGQVKILDFGLAKVTTFEEDPQNAPTAGTQPGTVMGTLAYMSPEQARGKPVDARSDIFSFGAVLYEMLSGRRAFRGDTAADTLMAILTGEPPELTATDAALSPSLQRIVRHCLEKDPLLALAGPHGPSAPPAGARAGRAGGGRGAGLAGRGRLPPRPADGRPVVHAPHVPARDAQRHALRARRPDRGLRRGLGRRAGGDLLDPPGRTRVPRPGPA